ncbi:MAG: hypothetical protein ACPLKQ_05045 [Candidatus Bathyarchaeales archaeon]
MFTNINDNSNNVGDTSEVYWFLDKALEELGMVKHLLYDKYDPYERLFLLSTLTFSGLINDGTEINNLLKELEKNRRKVWTWSLSFYLGVLARNYVKKRHRMLPNVNEIINVLKDVNMRLKEFSDRGDLQRSIDALFLEALVLDLSTDVLNLVNRNELYKDIESFDSALISKVLKECETKAIGLTHEYKTKLAYCILALRTIFNNVVDQEYLRKLLNDLINSMSIINIEHKVFILRVFTALQMIKERQITLRSIANEYKSRFMHTTEKSLLRELVAKLISESPFEEESNIKYTENKSITLRIELTEEQIESIAKPNVVQLCLLALGLMISGYHRSYVLPSPEEHNYIRFMNVVKDIEKNKIHDRLLFLDKQELDIILTKFLDENVWPAFRDKLIYESASLMFVAFALDYILVPIIGNLAHSVPSIIALVLLYQIVKKLADIMHAEYWTAIQQLFSKKLKQKVLTSFKDDLYKRLVTSG